MNTTTTNKREIAKLNEHEALKMLAVCGAATTKHVGLWGWPGSSSASQVEMSARTMKRLLAKSLVTKRSGIDGKTVWVLSKVGAEYINSVLENEGFRDYAHHGLDIGMNKFLSNVCYVNEYLAVKKTDDNVKFAVGKAGLRNGWYTQIEEADGGYMLDAGLGNVKLVAILVAENTYETVIKRYFKLKKVAEVVIIGDEYMINALKRAINNSR